MGLHGSASSSSLPTLDKRWFLHQASRFAHSFSPSLIIACLKATIAITLTLALIMIKPFTSLNPHPESAMHFMILVVVVAVPGRTIGGYVHNFLWGLAGLSLGVLVHVVLAALCDSPVAQGFIFALWVYLAALVRAGGPKYISFFLYGVLFSFNGIYAPIQQRADTLQPLHFDASWLLAYFEAYGWSLLISLVVNFFVYPTFSSTELRTLLISSLQNVSSLAHLTCKAYSKELDSDDEEQVRSLLIQTIRSDYLQLANKLQETGYEVSFSSKFRLRDWRRMIKNVQGLQQSLITASSALELIDRYDPKGINVKKHLLAKHESTKGFKDFRRGIDLVIGDIVEELYEGHKLHGLRSGIRYLQHQQLHHHQRIVDENGFALPNPISMHNDQSVPIGPSTLKRADTRETFVKMLSVGEKLRREVQRSEERQMHSRRGSVHSEAEQGTATSEETMTDAFELEENRNVKREEITKAGKGSKVDFLRRAWENFAQVQADTLIAIIKDGSLDIEDVLRIEEGMPGLQMVYKDQLPRAWTSSLVAETPLKQLRPRAPSSSHASRAEPSDTLDPAESGQAAISGALTKSYSLLFGLGQLTDELCDLSSVVHTDRKKRFRPYIYHTFAHKISSIWKPRSGMTLPEALAALKGHEYDPPKELLIQKLMKLERWMRSDRSLYAAKVAVGATIYTTFLLTPTLQASLFLRYGMTSSLITVIVAISPTLGQTTTTFILQIAGTGIGALYGFVVLEIFHNVGGYVYNPYGLVASITVWAVIASFILYKYAKFFSLGLLLMVGAGSMLILEWAYNELPEAKATLRGKKYDSPAIRLAHTVASMAISIGIAAFLQLFVLRMPARRKLRLEIAAITSALAKYNTLLQTNINLVAPGDDAPPPPPEALAKVQRELIKREIEIQNVVLKLPATFAFAKVEPAFGMPFRADLLLKIINSHQVILDRLREARTAVGTHGFNETVHHDFASCLFPYRLHSQRLSRVLFHLASTSLLCKVPLARDVPSSKQTWASFENDALVLSRRLSQLPRGEEELKRPGFLRYWFYLVSLGAVSSELEELEVYLGELFGEYLTPLP